jgi:hypothetical protein
MYLLEGFSGLIYIKEINYGGSTAYLDGRESYHRSHCLLASMKNYIDKYGQHSRSIPVDRNGPIHLQRGILRVEYGVERDE